MYTVQICSESKYVYLLNMNPISTCIPPKSVHILSGQASLEHAIHLNMHGPLFMHLFRMLALYMFYSCKVACFMYNRGNGPGQRTEAPVNGQSHCALYT